MFYSQEGVIDRVCSKSNCVSIHYFSSVVVIFCKMEKIVIWRRFGSFFNYARTGTQQLRLRSMINAGRTARLSVHVRKNELDSDLR